MKEKLRRLLFKKKTNTKHKAWEEKFNAEIARQYAIMEIADPAVRNDAWAAELLKH
jgi:hypothetical protein